MNTNNFKSSIHRWVNAAIVTLEPFRLAELAARLGRRWVNVVAVAVLLPAAATAAKKPCDPGAPTPASYTWDFPQETWRLFEQLKWHASQVSQQAEPLLSDAGAYRLSWQTHGDGLEQIRENVNAMGKLLCRLQVVRHRALPWQQKAIDRVLPGLVTLARHTEAAIETLNENRNRLFATDYAERVDTIYARAEWIGDSLDSFLEHARLEEKLQQTKDELEAKLQQLDVTPPTPGG